MATIQYAVLVSRPEAGPRVEHLYRHRADAEQCAEAYVAQLGLAAWAADLAPPLPVVRRADTWAALDDSPAAPGQRPVLRLFPSLEAAEVALEGARLIRAPVRSGMPVQGSVPRFAPSEAAGATPTGAAPSPASAKAPHPALSAG